MNFFTNILHILGSGAAAYITARNMRDIQTRPNMLAGLQLSDILKKTQFFYIYCILYQKIVTIIVTFLYHKIQFSIVGKFNLNTAERRNIK